jgi:putative membrane protein
VIMQPGFPGFPGFMFIGAIFWLMILVGVALLVIWVVRSHSLSPTIHPQMRETPLEILARRFAAGEIDADEYKRSRDLLGGGGPKP